MIENNEILGFSYNFSLANRNDISLFEDSISRNKMDNEDYMNKMKICIIRNEIFKNRVPSCFKFRKIIYYYHFLSTFLQK